MTLAPLLAAPAIVQMHALAALASIAITALIFTRARGTAAHRVLGWAWVVAMGATAISSFWVSSGGWVGPFGPIHLLSVLVTVGLVSGVRAARRGNITAHRKTMTSMAFWGLGVAGAFTLLPWRIMGQVVLGG
jgi:uncharacterized membrane protein